MKTIFTILLVASSFLTIAQTKKFEATNNQTGKVVTLEQGNRVKVTTQDRKKYVGDLQISNAETIAINGVDIALTNISSIKNYPKGGRKAKNILFGVGAGLIAGSGVAGLAKNGSAFSLFAAGTGTVITGALVNNKHKTLIYRNYIFKIVE